MGDTIPLIMATRDIRATEGAITAVEVTVECSAVACSVEVYLEKAMAAVDRTGAVAINLDSVKGGPPLVSDRSGI
jgi:hypothetical protein